MSPHSKKTMTLVVGWCLLFLPVSSSAFILRAASSFFKMKRQSFILVFQDKNNNNDWSADSQEWKFADFDDDIDWQKQLQAKKDGSFWTTFETSNNETDNNTNSSSTPAVDDDMLAEAWINTLQSVSAEETEFIILEADRAEMARQMEEWNFPSEVIASSLGVAVDTSLETEDDVVGMDEFRKKSFIEDIDLQAVESHETVEKDPETGEPIRTQMVYVDEHTCIGCTNCAMIAQSTFYMNQEHGRARVFQQWGDDDETIQIAIETCPVDCIHYVPFEELAKLEIERRDQNLNPKARLVSQGEMGSTQSHRVGGAVAFTPAQQISGNMGTRCNNCPSRGCKSCPMYGVGLNPDFLKKEQERKDRIAKKRLQELRESQQKTAEL